MIYYRAITNSSTEPSSKQEGDMWIKPISNITYQVYIYLASQWRALLGGGSYISETNADTYYYHIVFDNTEPSNTGLNVGWFWYNQSTRELFIYNGVQFISLLAF